MLVVVVVVVVVVVCTLPWLLTSHEATEFIGPLSSREFQRIALSIRV